MRGEAGVGGVGGVGERRAMGVDDSVSRSGIPRIQGDIPGSVDNRIEGDAQGCADSANGSTADSAGV